MGFSFQEEAEEKYQNSGNCCRWKKERKNVYLHWHCVDNTTPALWATILNLTEQSLIFSHCTPKRTMMVFCTNGHSFLFSRLINAMINEHKIIWLTAFFFCSERTSRPVLVYSVLEANQRHWSPSSKEARHQGRVGKHLSEVLKH